MALEMRVLQADEWDVWYDHLELAFGGVPESPEERDLYRSLTERERSLAVWDGESCVASAGAFSFRLSVPGGALVPAAGVTMVGVAPTHRRRGVLTSMMRRQLDDIRAGGEPLAVLTASEPEIYGRFGYGTGAYSLSVDIDTTRVRLCVPPGTDEVRLRLVDPEKALPDCERVYAQLLSRRPGMTARQPGWERLGLLDPPSMRGGGSPVKCVVAEREDGEVVGYARYRVKPDWDLTGSQGAVVVNDLDALDPAVTAALWRYLFEIDLTWSVRATKRPVDDPVLHLVSDVRRTRPTQRDSLHVRLVDLPAALEARTYGAPLDVVVEVEDAFCPWNEGRWRLTADAKGAAACVRTADPADLELSVRELGSAYLGGTSLTSLGAAGRVRELRAGALPEASRAFAGDVAPWLPHGF
ncbi:MULTISPECIES: GNAT family N-acetyltransferase [unclassified Streptomyces]|uniref:GNAT family N-acetyltransferase n=1 Tax=unclassified Streptomyces TaxID=2593676 RepID=UPI00224D568A|nr:MULTISPECIES: GNAT family N-acetyltransferase [unclassified Streptomyces]MCX4525876.1 GNAT family N-acetyltransferase [Streptomyces sp. NBC_01551]MCX4543562.1 GNAT family N-acetyltransferase [Streptomyces sp. NBC_01565]